MNWNSDTGKALKISLMLHGVIFAIVAIGSIISMIFNKPVVPPHVFELQGIKGQQHVGAPGRLAGDRKAKRTDKPSTTASSNLNLPKLDKRNPAPMDDGDDAEPPPAKAAPKQTAKAAAKPQKTAATKKPAKANGTKAAAKAKATVSKTAKAESMSYSDFAKQHKISTSKSGTGKNGTGKKSKKSGKSSGINASAIVSDMKNNLSWGDGGDGGGGLPGGSGMTSGDMDALADYFARVRALIDSNFSEPKGVMQQVSALVQFTILANGTVTGVSVVQSSGNDAFDAAAVSAVRNLGRLDPPPGNMAYTKKIEFQGKRGD